jgi:hemerythrin superfamily protein
MGEPEHDLLQVLVADHQEVAQLLADVDQLPLGDPTRIQRIEQVTIALVAQAAAKEQYLYPILRERMPEGDRTTDRAFAEHAEIERILQSLQEIRPSHPEHGETLRALQLAVAVHLRREEVEVYPRLAALLDPEECQELGRRMRFAEATGPTRPHPSVPHRPPWNRIAATGIGILDRIRDLATGRAR